jgi:hypothetical protein
MKYFLYSQEAEGIRKLCIDRAFFITSFAGYQVADLTKISW